MRRTQGIIIVASAILLSVPTPGLAQQPARPAMPSITDVDAFTPAEAVTASAQRELPVARDPGALLAPQAWVDMRAYSDRLGGVGLIVMVDGQVVGESYRAGAGPATRTLSQSMHKSVLGLAYGMALRDGIIKSVRDPVGRYIAEWRDDPRGKIPVRAFLTMASGLKNYSMVRQEPQARELVFGKDINAVALTTPIDTQAEAAFTYSNATAQIAGIALERAVMAKTGKRYAQWLSEQLWQPLGNGPATVWLDREGGSPHYFAWLETDLRSWARIGELVRNKGRAGKKQIIPSRWVKQATRASRINPNYGYFIWRGTPWKAQRSYAADNPVTARHSAPYLAPDVLFFDGFGGQRVYIVPSRKLVIARTGETAMDFDDAILPNLAIAGLRP